MKLVSASVQHSNALTNDKFGKQTKAAESNRDCYEIFQPRLCANVVILQGHFEVYESTGHQLPLSSRRKAAKGRNPLK